MLIAIIATLIAWQPDAHGEFYGFSRDAPPPSDVVRDYIAVQAPADLDQLLEKFPYAGYLDHVSFTNLSQIQSDRAYIRRAYGDGESFLYHLGEHFIRLYPAPLTSEELTRKVDIGERYLLPHGPGISKANVASYRIVGYFVLGHVARRLEQGIARGDIDPEQPAFKTVIDRLRKNKVLVAIQTSSWVKLRENVRKGNWRYVFNRAKSEFHSLRGSGRTDKIAIALLVGPLALVGGLFLLLWWRRVSWRKPVCGIAAAGWSVFVLSYIYVLDPPGPIPGAIGAKHRASSTSLTMATPINMHRRDGAYCMQIYPVKTQQTRIGDAVFLRRPCAKARYFPQNVGARLSRTRAIVATSGSFTNNYKEPEGLTVDHGEIINAVIMHDRHALALVEDEGGIRIIDLKRKHITLPTPDGPLDLPNPLDSLIGYSRLLDWCREYRATVFQTQLLAYSDKLRIDPAKAKPTLRERRFLALVRSDAELFHVVINLPGPQHLGKISHEMFHLFHKRQFTVEAMLNLDTGAQDVLHVYDNRYRKIPGIQGTKQASTNLLVYHKSP